MTSIVLCPRCPTRPLPSIRNPVGGGGGSKTKFKANSVRLVLDQATGIEFGKNSNKIQRSPKLAISELSFVLINFTFFSCQLFQDPNHEDYETYKHFTNFPAVFADVAELRPWIDKTIKDNGGAFFCNN